MSFKQRYNTDIDFKRKFQRATIFFVLFEIVVVAFYAANSNVEYTVQTDEQPIQIEGNYLPTDTTAFIDDKTYFYQKQMQDSIDNADISIENPLGSSIADAANQNRNIENNDKEIDDYLQNRRKSVEKMQSNNNSQRNYNPYGNSNDYVTVSSRNAQPQQNDNNYSTNYSENRRQNPFDQPKEQQQPSQNQLNEDEGVEVRAKLLSQREYVKSGEQLTFVLLDDAMIGGVQARKGQTVAGIANEQNERLVIRFNTIKIGNKIVKANMKLFGSDGIEGIAISGSNEKSYSSQKGAEIAQSTTSKIPIVGGVVSDAIGTGSQKTDEKIKLTKNITCSIIIY